MLTVELILIVKCDKIQITAYENYYLSILAVKIFETKADSDISQTKLSRGQLNSLSLFNN